MSGRARLLPIVLIASSLAVLLLAGCGSSKPGYCSKVNDLKKSVQDLPNVNVVQNGTSGLTSALQKVESNAKAVVSSAKSDFPNETSALSNSLNGLAQAIKNLPSSPTAGQIATIAGQASATVTAVKNFSNATSSKCK
jgi:outer membrane murein-binding lipoprotein Lpp